MEIIPRERNVPDSEIAEMFERIAFRYNKIIELKDVENFSAKELNPDYNPPQNIEYHSWQLEGVPIG